MSRQGHLIPKMLTSGEEAWIGADRAMAGVPLAWSRPPLGNCDDFCCFLALDKKGENVHNLKVNEKFPAAALGEDGKRNGQWPKNP
ncbi:MAG: hypothetical protein LBP92_09285 [Deltaproteobacteria bacterium]|jgi:hypothetical protein|nr:hypothetical protein [Deltaproteobacteria bacterium]